MNDLGQKIQKIRELKSLTQEYMAAQLELTQSAYSKLENHGDSINFKKLEKIAAVFGMKPEHIINFDVNQVFHLSGENHIHLENDPANKNPDHKEKLKKKNSIILKLKKKVEALKKK